METNLEKFAIVVIVFLILFLFVSGLSPYITGKTAYSDSFDLSGYPYPFIKNNVYNSLYIVVPDSPSLNEIGSAERIADGLQSTRQHPPSIITVSELPSTPSNTIIIGSPERNPLVRQYLDEILNPNEGVIKLVKKGISSTLIVTAENEQKLVKTADILKYYYSQPLEGVKITFSGGSLLFE